MVAVGLFYFHLFFFIRASHKEAFDPGMGGEGARRVKVASMAYGRYCSQESSYTEPMGGERNNAATVGTER